MSINSNTLYEICKNLPKEDIYKCFQLNKKLSKGLCQVHILPKFDPYNQKSWWSLYFDDYFSDYFDIQIYWLKLRYRYYTRSLRIFIQYLSKN